MHLVPQSWELVMRLIIGSIREVVVSTYVELECLCSELERVLGTRDGSLGRLRERVSISLVRATYQLVSEVKDLVTHTRCELLPDGSCRLTGDLYTRICQLESQIWFTNSFVP
jgi:hypothetical protein